MRHSGGSAHTDDRGSIAVFTAATAVALVWLLAVVLDGGRLMRAQSETFGIAGAAARAAAQELDQTAALEGELRLDERAAEQAALEYLAARHHSGTVHVEGLEVTVTAHRTVELRLLPIGPAAIEETATARAATEGVP